MGLCYSTRIQPEPTTLEEIQQAFVAAGIYKSQFRPTVNAKRLVFVDS